jgi:hypothetical protein
MLGGFDKKTPLTRLDILQPPSQQPTTFLEPDTDRLNLTVVVAGFFTASPQA